MIHSKRDISFFCYKNRAVFENENKKQFMLIEIILFNQIIYYRVKMYASKNIMFYIMLF